MQETREALVLAALEAFAEEGLDAPSLDSICARAGYTRGAFYVHFPDRDALLVAVMDRIGASFLESVFSMGTSADGGARTSMLAEAAQRFLRAVAEGRYPLMSPQATSTPRAGPQIRPHQLLDACARSTVVRDRYRALVEASVEHVAALTRADQSRGMVRSDVEPSAIGAVLLATVIGAQTMAELGVAIDPVAISVAFFRMLSGDGALSS